MILRFINSQVQLFKNIFFKESAMMGNFLQVLFKEKNTGEKWTQEDKKIIKKGLLRISYYIPFLIIFLLPAGSILLPLLVNFIDRRKEMRK